MWLCFFSFAPESVIHRDVQRLRRTVLVAQIEWACVKFSKYAEIAGLYQRGESWNIEATGLVCTWNAHATTYGGIWKCLIYGWTRQTQRGWGCFQRDMPFCALLMPECIVRVEYLTQAEKGSPQLLCRILLPNTKSQQPLWGVCPMWISWRFDFG